MTILKQENFYHTSDLALATAISLFYPIEAVDKTNPRKAQFLFQRDQRLDELVEEYWRSGLKVDAQQYFNQLRLVKARLYGEE